MSLYGCWGPYHPHVASWSLYRLWGPCMRARVPIQVNRVSIWVLGSLCELQGGPYMGI